MNIRSRLVTIASAAVVLVGSAATDAGARTRAESQCQYLDVALCYSQLCVDLGWGGTQTCERCDMGPEFCSDLFVLSCCW